MSRTLRHLLTVVLALTGVALPVVAAAAPTPVAHCDTPWGSGGEWVTDAGWASLVEVRTGRHECFDRVVFALAGPPAGYRVEYVDQVSQDGSGEPVPVPGGARLLVNVNHPAYDDEGNPTLRPSASAGEQVADVSGYPALDSVVYASSFEGTTLFGVGVRAVLPFRVFTLAGPDGGSRIVLDVAHGWS